MKQIPLSGGKAFALVDDEDYDLVSRFRWRLNSEGYPVAEIRLARLIAKTSPDMVADHKDRNRLNATRINLRNCSKAQNSYNRGKFSNKTVSRFKNVYPSHQKTKNPWKAQIKYLHKNLTLGTFPKEHLAALMYDFWATYLHQEYAVTNFKVISTTEKPIGGIISRGRPVPDDTGNAVDNGVLVAGSGYVPVQTTQG